MVMKPSTLISCCNGGICCQNPGWNAKIFLIVKFLNFCQFISAKWFRMANSALVTNWQYTEVHSTSGIDGHLCITYPQFTDTGKEHLFVNTKQVIVVSPNEKFSKWWGFNHLTQFYNLLFGMLYYVSAYNI